MQTKQERLRYGQQLRRQIQLKEEQKRAETNDKRKNNEPSRNNQNFITATQKEPTVTPVPRNQRPNQVYQQSQPQQMDIVNKKEMYQKKLEQQAYFPFGKMGIKPAKNKIMEERQNLNSYQEQNLKQEYDYLSHQPVSQPSQPSQSNTVPVQIYNPQHYIAQQQQLAQQRAYPPQSFPQAQYQHPNAQYPPQMYQPYPQAGNQYPSAFTQIPSMNPQYPPQQNYYQPEFYHPSMGSQRPKMSDLATQQPRLKDQYINQPYSKQSVSYDNIKASSKQIEIREEPNAYPREQSSHDNRTIKRNILLYENQTNQALSKKMKSKEDTRGILEQQIMQKKRLKQQQEERIRREDLKLQAENRRYIQIQNKKIQQQNNKKRRQEEAKRENEERSRQMREQMEKEALEEKKKKRMNVPQYIPPPPVEVVQPVQQQQRSHPVSRQRVRQQRIQVQPQSSVQPQSQQYYQTIQKAFNTDISRDVLREQKQRDEQRKKKDKHFNELKRNINNMKQQLINHNELHKLQKQKAILEIEKMRLQKQKAEKEVYRLRQQLNHKNDDRDYQQRLRLAIKNTDRDRYEQETHIPKPMRPKQEEMFVKKTYSYQIKEQPKKVQYPPQQQKQYLLNPKLSNLDNQFEDGLQSLYGQTVKIPINLGVNNLTMSNVDQFNINNIPKPSTFSKQPQYKQQQIEYEDPIKRQFRKHLSGEDELDKLINEPKHAKQNNKWGQMSSIDSQGTKQIQQLLKQHQFQYGKSQSSARPGSRPKSKLSNVGKQSLNGNLGYMADGFSLQSNVNDGTYVTNGDGTFNILKINDNNDRRLQKLRQMQNDTIGQDQQFSQLDRLLKKY